MLVCLGSFNPPLLLSPLSASSPPPPSKKYYFDENTKKSNSYIERECVYIYTLFKTASLSSIIHYTLYSIQYTYIKRMPILSLGRLHQSQSVSFMMMMTTTMMFTLLLLLASSSQAISGINNTYIIKSLNVHTICVLHIHVYMPVHTE